MPGNRAPDAYAEDLAALIATLGLKDAVLVGQSMGGWTCLEYALREPKKVRALVMASTSGTIDYNQLDDSNIREWAGRAPGALAELQKQGIHPAAGERMAREQPALAPKGRAVRVPAAGHSVYFERAAQFNQLVESVL